VDTYDVLLTGKVVRWHQLRKKSGHNAQNLKDAGY